jgi:hypothetical protein
MKALSIKQPWAWAIIHAGKIIENRPRRTHLRETIAIHASLRPARDWEQWYPKRALKVPLFDDLHFGAIIGFADIVDCVEDHRSKWFQGPFGYVIQNPRPLRQPVACKGALGFWNVPENVLRRCRDAMGRAR